MRATFGAVLAVASGALAYACGHAASPITPTASSSMTVVPSQAGVTPPSPAAVSSAVSDPGGEWNLTTPAGLPRGGCISLADISGNHLDWTVQATPGHAHPILMQGIVTREERPDCSPLDRGGERPQMLQVKGGGWTFAATEEGTRTISWPTEECTEDGGRFKIDVMVKRGVPSIGDADRESIELLVNCGFFRKR